MSRSGYSEGDDRWPQIMWRGAVSSAINGKRGQAFLRELAEAMDAMPVKELIADELVSGDSYCALGVVGAKRGLDMSGIDPDESAQVANAFGIAGALAAEIEYINDDDYICINESDERRWRRVRNWVSHQIKEVNK